MLISTMESSTLDYNIGLPLSTYLLHRMNILIIVERCFLILVLILGPNHHGNCLPSWLDRTGTEKNESLKGTKCLERS